MSGNFSDYKSVRGEDVPEIPKEFKGSIIFFKKGDHPRIGGAGRSTFHFAHKSKSDMELWKACFKYQKTLWPDG